MLYTGVSTLTNGGFGFVIFSPRALFPLLHGHGGGCGRALQNLLSRILAALERFVRPHVAPLSVPAAIADSELVEIAVYRLECGRTIKVEDDVRVAKRRRLAKQHAILLFDQADTP